MRVSLRDIDPSAIEVNTVTGSVAGVSTRTISSQNITSSGGTGGFYVGSVRFDDPVRIHSQTQHTTITEFFVQVEGGKEIPVRLQNLDFQVRDGHVVSLQTVSVPGGPAAMLSVRNHTTDESKEAPGWEGALFHTPPKIGILLGIGITIALWIGQMLFITLAEFLARDLTRYMAPLFTLGLLAIPAGVMAWAVRANSVSKERTAMRQHVFASAKEQYAAEQRRLSQSIA